MSNELLAGFARVDITPTESVPLAGYGATSTRMSQNVLSPLYSTCLALTDGSGNTVLFFQNDLCITPAHFANAVRQAVSSKTGVAASNVMVSATHTHSGPDLNNDDEPAIPCYIKTVTEKMAQCAVDALADRKPATMAVGRVNTENLTFTRHYVQENGNVVGDNFGDKKASPIVGHTVEADRQLQIIRFMRMEKDIVLMNFGTHPIRTGSAKRYEVSADIVGACREKMEQTLNCNFQYFTGAAGDQSAVSRIPEENLCADYIEHGEKLADYALQLMDRLTPVKSGQIKVQERNVECIYDYDDGDLLQYTNLVFDAYKNGGALEANKVGRPLGINSIYHARAILRRSRNTEHSTTMAISAVAVGDVAFVLAPFEMFGGTGKAIKAGSPYGMTFVHGLSNGHHGYLATEAAFEHGCYEVDHRFFVRGTAEKIANAFLDILRNMKETE